MFDGWGTFCISDLFEIELSKGDNQIDQLKKGNIPLVSAGMSNNGIVGYVDSGDGKSQMFEESLITVDMFGKAFYHPYKFYAVSHGRINILIPLKKFEKEVLLFITAAINKSTEGIFSYNRMCSQKRLSKININLPILEDGTIDYEGITKTILKLKNNRVLKFKEKINRETLKFEKLSKKNNNFKVYRLDELFNIYTGQDLIINKVEKGEIPVISHKSTDNGIATRSREIKNRKKFDHKRTISLADRGNFKAYVQKEDFYIGTRVKGLETKSDIPYYSLIYIANSINMQSSKFSYGYNATSNIKDLKIVLPSKGEKPDYEFMDLYIKNCILKKKENYINYIENTKSKV